MGYTTDFEGRLLLSRDLTVKELAEFNKLTDYEEDSYRAIDPKYDERKLSSYMQWETDGMSLYWNDGEKFYDYVEWLKWIIEVFFTPLDVKLNGAINWQGEEIGDVGRIEVKNSVVTSRELKIEDLVECPHCGEGFKLNG